MPLPRQAIFVLAGISVLAVLFENPAAAQAAKPAAPSQIQIVSHNSDSLNFQSSSITPILDLYGQLSGKQLIRDSNVIGLPPVSLNLSGLNKDETLKLISATLLLNNVAIIPIDDRTEKIVTIGITKNPRSEGVRLYTNESDLPNGDQIVSYYMSFDHIPAGEAVGIFEQVSPVHTYGGYVPATSSNGVVITENSSVVRELIALKKSIDARRPSGNPPHDRPPSAKGLLFVLTILVLVFAAGYFYGRRRLRKKLASAAS